MIRPIIIDSLVQKRVSHHRITAVVPSIPCPGRDEYQRVGAETATKAATSSHRPSGEIEGLLEFGDWADRDLFVMDPDADSLGFDNTPPLETKACCIQTAGATPLVRESSASPSQRPSRFDPESTSKTTDPVPGSGKSPSNGSRTTRAGWASPRTRSFSRAPRNTVLEFMVSEQPRKPSGGDVLS